MRKQFLPLKSQALFLEEKSRHRLIRKRCGDICARAFLLRQTRRLPTFKKFRRVVWCRLIRAAFAIPDIGVGKTLKRRRKNLCPMSSIRRFAKLCAGKVMW